LIHIGGGSTVRRGFETKPVAPAPLPVSIVVVCEHQPFVRDFARVRSRNTVSISRVS
jgi:hypothetical protein